MFTERTQKPGNTAVNWLHLTDTAAKWTHLTDTAVKWIHLTEQSSLSLYLVLCRHPVSLCSSLGWQWEDECMFSCNLSLHFLHNDWGLSQITCYCSSAVVEQRQEPTQRVEWGEENAPAAPARDWTRICLILDLALYCRPTSLLPLRGSLETLVWPQHLSSSQYIYSSQPSYVKVHLLLTARLCDSVSAPHSQVIW